MNWRGRKRIKKAATGKYSCSKAKRGPELNSGNEDGDTENPELTEYEVRKQNSRMPPRLKELFE